MKWLSLRQPGKHADRDRWQEAEAWTVLRSAQLGSPRSELVREHVHLADEVRLVRGLVGYATSLEAMGSARDLDGALAREAPATRRYLASRGVRFQDIVEEKRRRRVTLTEGGRAAS
jgi:hypothetical protein